LSEGQFEIELYPAGEIVGAFENFDAVREGVLEGAFHWPAYWGGVDTTFDLLGGYVMAFTGYDFLNWLYQAGGEKMAQELYEQYGLKYHTVCINPPESGFHTNVPIQRIDDFKGLKLRCPGRAPGYILEQVGAQSVTIAGGEMYAALERGLVDGIETSVPSLNWDMGIAEVTKYWVCPGWECIGAVNSVMFNMDSWNSLPDQMKTYVEYAARDTTRWALGNQECTQIGMIEKFEGVGVTIYHLPKEDLDRIQQWAWEWMEIEAAQNPTYAEMARSMIEYLKEIEPSREYYIPFAPEYTRSTWPDLSETHLEEVKKKL
jgi:TRAP-type mannitol/chloroaromatic compound transport system substrate-binding protein